MEMVGQPMLSMPDLVPLHWPRATCASADATTTRARVKPCFAPPLLGTPRPRIFSWLEWRDAVDAWRAHASAGLNSRCSWMTDSIAIRYEQEISRNREPPRLFFLFFLVEAGILSWRSCCWEQSELGPRSLC